MTFLVLRRVLRAIWPRRSAAPAIFVRVRETVTSDEPNGHGLVFPVIGKRCWICGEAPSHPASLQGGFPPDVDDETSSGTFYLCIPRCAEEHISRVARDVAQAVAPKDPA